MSDRQTTLLGIARAALAERLGGAAFRAPEEPWLTELGAAFVTLRKGTKLHGCIGTVEAVRPLGVTVRRNAVLAGFEDPRSRPLQMTELDLVRIEVSVLSAPERVAVDDEDDARTKIRPFVDGVILSCARQRGVFLPQVWKSMPDSRSFLDALKEKTGLVGWRRDVVVERFSVEKFSEQGFGGD